MSDCELNRQFRLAMASAALINQFVHNAETFLAARKFPEPEFSITLYNLIDVYRNLIALNDLGVSHLSFYAETIYDVIETIDRLSGKLYHCKESLSFNHDIRIYSGTGRDWNSWLNYLSSTDYFKGLLHSEFKRHLLDDEDAQKCGLTISLNPRSYATE